MKKILLSLICLFTTANLLAQKHSFSLVAGATDINFINIGYDARSHYATTPNSSFSPYIGFNYYLPDSAIPLSIGLGLSTFKLNAIYSYNGNPAISQKDNYSYQYFLRFIQLQMPITYQWRYKHTDLAIGIAPTIYIMSTNDFRSILPYSASPATAYQDLGKGISYNFPQAVSASFNLTASYSYFFAQIGRYQLGLKTFADVALLMPLQTTTNYDYSMRIKSTGDIYARSENTSLKYLPVSLGVGFILKN